MTTSIIRTIRTLLGRLLTYLDLQLFISLCSWPLLAAWGLPFSPAGILGNLLFTPFLSIFLLVSSLLFLCELLYLPSGLFAWTLETITFLWSLLLCQSSRSWLFLGAHPPFIITLCLPALACLIMITSRSQRQRITMLSSIYFTCGFLIPWCLAYRERTLTISYGKGFLTLTQSQGSVFLIDPGILGGTHAAPRSIQYTLVPFLFRHGITKIDALIVPKPSYTVFKALSLLVESFPIKTIYLPAWKGAWHNLGWASWEALLRKARDHGTTIHCLRDPITLTCGTVVYALALSPKQIKRNKLIYQELIPTPVITQIRRHPPSI